jgi:hypothetical protein
MKNAGGAVLAALLVVFGILGLTWLLQGNDFFLFKVFAPKYEQVRRDTFEKSRAFNQGMVQELDNMRFEYVKANPAERDALASIILHRASGYDLHDPSVSPELRTFIEKLREERSK